MSIVSLLKVFNYLLRVEIIGHHGIHQRSGYCFNLRRRLVPSVPRKKVKIWIKVPVTIVFSAVKCRYSISQLKSNLSKHEVIAADIAVVSGSCDLRDRVWLRKLHPIISDDWVELPLRQFFYASRLANSSKDHQSHSFPLHSIRQFSLVMARSWCNWLHKPVKHKCQLISMHLTRIQLCERIHMAFLEY